MQLLEVLSLQLGTSSYPLQFTHKIFQKRISLTSDINFWMKIYIMLSQLIFQKRISLTSDINFWMKIYIMLSQLCMKGSALCMCTKKFIINFGLLNNMLERWHTKGLSYLACNTSESFLFHALDGL
jgi:hypothetical protein